LRADVATAEALGVPHVSVVTLLSVQVGGVEEVRPVDRDLFRRCLEEYVEWCEVAKVGAVPREWMFGELAERLEGLRVVWDPVFEAEKGGALSEVDPGRALEVFGEAVDVVTPNARELGEWVGRRVRSVSEAEVAARELLESFDWEGVLVTGGHLVDRCDVWVPAEGEAVAWELPEGEGAHGSGCVVSAALACYLCRGVGLEEAVERAVRFARRAVRGAFELPVGRVVSPGAWVRERAAFGRAVRNVLRALRMLESDPVFARAVPQVGMNVAEVFDPERGLEGVVGLSGRVILEGDRVRVVGRPVPGGSKHVGTVALTAHRLDPSVRAAVNARFEEELVERARELGLVVASFDRSEEPEEVESTMEWGTRVAFERAGETPDVIWDEGDVGKEPMIRVLGGSAVEAVSKLRMLLG